jgi:hypothetical protein
MGHAPAAVAAKNNHIAEEALGKIKVEYEPPARARRPRRDARRRALLSGTRYTKSMGKTGDKPSNIALQPLRQRSRGGV